MSCRERAYRCEIVLNWITTNDEMLARAYEPELKKNVSNVVVHIH